MNGITDFNGVVEYIEARLSGEIRIEEMAKLAKMSVYEFRRIFSFVAGISVSEYVRRRRLSAAATELLRGGPSVTDLAVKYGYDTPSSFSRAFKEFHGVSPSELAKGGKARLFTKISFDLQVRGGREIDYEIREDSAFSVVGYAGRSDLRDTECCEKVWEEFYRSPAAKEIGRGDGKIYAVYQNGENCVDCAVGLRDTKGGVSLPACTWACFTLRTVDDRTVNEFYKMLLFDWPDASGLSRIEGLPNLEVYPSDMERDGFEWEIRIPVERKTYET